VWLRPDNLVAELPDDAQGRARVLRSRDVDPRGLAAQLWDLPGWSSTGRTLLREMASATGVPARFATAAAIVRHLLTDPVLPTELEPRNWPGAQLRGAYADFAAEIEQRRHQLVEVT
jgi:phenylacetic acid degradation operon negative regulatory protein